MHAPPCPWHGENGCSGPENFQACPALPHPANAPSLTVITPHPEDFTPYPAPPQNFFPLACPEAKKGCLVHPCKLCKISNLKQLPSLPSPPSSTAKDEQSSALLHHRNPVDVWDKILISSLDWTLSDKVSRYKFCTNVKSSKKLSSHIQYISAESFSWPNLKN